MWPIVAILAVPLIEIALFIMVGGALGLWPTLALVVMAAIAGTVVIRAQGARALDRTRQAFARQADPSLSLLDGALVVLGGVMLIAPGFLSDAVGLALLLPPVRQAVLRRVSVMMTAARASASGGTVVIDGTWEEVPPATSTREPSGWTRH